MKTNKIYTTLSQEEKVQIMTVTKKLKPLVIGRYKKPRCFKNFPVQNFDFQIRQKN